MKTLIAFICLALTGCANTQFAEHGANLADQARVTAEWTLCNAISVGAWRRAYGEDVPKADAWRVLCAEPSLITVPSKE